MLDERLDDEFKIYSYYKVCTLLLKIKVFLLSVETISVNLVGDEIFFCEDFWSFFLDNLTLFPGLYRQIHLFHYW